MTSPKFRMDPLGALQSLVDSMSEGAMHLAIGGTVGAI